MTDEERISLLEARLEALLGVVGDLVEYINYHDHRYRTPNEDRYDPFIHYSETREPERKFVMPVAVL